MARTSNKTKNKEVLNNVSEEISEKVINEAPKKVAKKSKAEIFRNLKKNASNIDIEIMNLTNGSFNYVNGYDSIRIEYPGETAIVGLDLLIKMKNSPSLNKLFISVVDVYSDEYTVENILDILDLLKITKGEAITLEYLDGLLNDTNVDEFEKIINEYPTPLVKRLCERAIYLASVNGFDSTGKRTIIEKAFHNSYLFKSC